MSSTSLRTDVRRAAHVTGNRVQPLQSSEVHVSTRVSASARLSAACQEQLREQLDLHLDPTIEIGRLHAFLDSERIDVPAIEEIISTKTVSSVLGKLAPGAFGWVCDLLARARDAAPDQQALAASAQAKLAEAVAAADARIAVALRGITAGAFTQAAVELDYAVSVCRGTTALGVELRRGREVVLLRIHNGGELDFDHFGLLDAKCGQRQLSLERAVERRGITLAKRHQRYHDAAGGGEQIAGARGDACLAHGAVPDT
jgi:hypothetical protein